MIHKARSKRKKQQMNMRPNLYFMNHMSEIKTRSVRILLSSFILSFCLSTAFSQTTQTITTTGTGTFTVPAGVTTIIVEVWGAGGSGGGNSSGSDGGGGGGGGAYSKSTLTGVSGTLNYSVGSGGAANAARIAH